MVIGFEMFPRRVQDVLDRWVAGELSESEFLQRSHWAEVWGFDAAYYLPLFHFARMHRVPMVALNVERELVRRIGREGLDAVPENEREGVGRPEPASAAYLRELHAVYARHGRGASGGVDDPAFQRFVAGQLMWDRAMAEGHPSGPQPLSGAPGGCDHGPWPYRSGRGAASAACTRHRAHGGTPALGPCPRMRAARAGQRGCRLRRGPRHRGPFRIEPSARRYTATGKRAGRSRSACRERRVCP